MPATKTKTTVAKKRAAAKPAEDRTARGGVALDGLELSLDEAQKALAALRRDLTTGGRALVKDVDVAVTRARRDLRRTRKAIQRDLDSLGSAVKPRRTAARAGTTASSVAGKKRRP